MLRDVIHVLICPQCGGDLSLGDGSVLCSGGHVFDIARQGYVNLVGGDAKPAPGDTSSMVEARETFLAAGHYVPLVDRVVEEAVSATAGTSDGCVVDVGAGTGHYLSAVLDRLSTRVGLALDVSKYAARRAARGHLRGGAAVCDIWRGLPVRTDTAAVILNTFAPRNGAEFHRILRHDGTLLVVAPTERHLEELVGPLELLSVDERKEARVHEQLDPYFIRSETSTCRFSMILCHTDIEALVAMGPSAWHTEAAETKRRIRSLPKELPVTASVTVSAHRPR